VSLWRLRLGLPAIILALCACATVPPPATAVVPTAAPAVASPSPVPPTVATAPSTLTAAPTASTLPAATATPAATQLPAPSATPKSALRQLTTGGCCAQPYWSADGSQVRYIDRPSSGQPSGIWAVGLTGGAPVFVTDRVGIYSPDEKLVAYLDGGQTTIERVGGDHWRVDNGGRAVVFSPDSSHIAWQANSSLFNLDRRLVQVWVTAVDGTGARQVASLTGGSLAGWFPDGQHLLVTSRDGADTLIQSLSVAGGGPTTIVKVPRLQGLALSPRGGWLAYVVAFSGDASQDGLWVIGTDGHGARRLDTFGSFAWQDEGHLIVIPLEDTSTVNRVLQVEAVSGRASPLTDPAVTPFQIAQGMWSLSPNGAHLAFVSAADHNIWVINLTE